MGKFCRPTKKPVIMRLDTDVIAWLNADGRGCQPKANWLLRHAMLHSTRERGLRKREGFRRKTTQQKGKA
jgi:BrnA antitoxin of type II toxin-antitoxin system